MLEPRVERNFLEQTRKISFKGTERNNHRNKNTNKLYKICIKKKLVFKTGAKKSALLVRIYMLQ